MSHFSVKPKIVARSESLESSYEFSESSDQ